MREEYLKEGLKIVATLNSLTYQAYIVGGAVRDYIMQNDFVDIDIATSATPTEIQQIFHTVKMDYANLGFVVLKQNDFIFEISTFKSEEYQAPRIPAKVYYSNNLSDDIMRRDFTINALALTDNLKIIDLVKGQKDIRNKKIRVIGKAKKRFMEDPLRILRAYELIARFNFNLTFKTSLGITKANKELSAISNFQISKAINKIFNSLYGKKAVNQMLLYKTNRELVDYADGLYIIGKHYKKLDTIEKFALCFAYKNIIPTNTSFDKLTLSKITNLMKVIDYTKDFDKDNNIKPQDIIKFGFDDLASALKINHYIRKKYPNLVSRLKAMYKNLRIKTIKDLKIKGSDIVELNGGVKGSYVSEVINELASEVALELLQNDYTELIKRAKEICDLMNKEEEPVEAEKREEPIQESVEEAQEEIVETEQTDSNFDLIGLKIKYDLMLQEKVDSTLKMFLRGTETEDEKKRLRDQIKSKVKEALLEQNEEFRKLKERGLI